MRRIMSRYFRSICLFLCSALSACIIAAPPPAGSGRVLGEHYGHLPMSFEPNQGQTDPRVQFVARGPGYTLFLSATESVLSLRGAQQDCVIRMRLAGARPASRVAALEPLASTANYFIGSDPARWRRHVPAYRKVRYERVLPGVDVIYYGRRQQLEYDLVVAPGADASSIQLTFDGADKLRIGAGGELVIESKAGPLYQRPPVVYQEVDGTRRVVAANYVVKGRRDVAFRVGDYDSSRPLIIDPVLAFSTYLGSNSTGAGIAVDAAGDAYVTGTTNSLAFPTRSGFQGASGGGRDVFVTKFNSTGTGLIYSTYLGGSNDDVGSAIAIDADGNAYVAGTTFSSNFPLKNAARGNYAGSSTGTYGGDAFITKINPAGSGLIYSTYLGGSSDDTALSITADSSGSAYVTGITASSNFPVQGGIQGSLKGSTDAFAAKLTASGAIAYSTYLGGGDQDQGFGIAADSAGNAYIAGSTSSVDFPTLNPFQRKTCIPTTFNPKCANAFVAKLNEAGNSLIYSTYLGGQSVDSVQAIAVDHTGSAYVAGFTNSPDFPATAGVVQDTFRGGPDDAFVAKLNPAGSGLVYATFLGGSGDDVANGISIDAAGNAYVAGFTGSKDFPTASPAQGACGDANCNDVFVTALNVSGSALLYSTYLGGADFDRATAIALDRSGAAYITGEARSPNFPITQGAYQTIRAGTIDAFVAKLIVPVVNPVPAVTQLSPPSTAAGGTGLNLTVTGTGFLPGSTVLWNGSARQTIFVDSGTLTASIPASDLALSGTAQVSVFNPSPGGGTSNSLQFQIISPPVVFAGGVVNAASFSKQPPPPGAIAALFGTNLAAGPVTATVTPLPTILGGVSVLLDGVAAPLFFVSPLQINFQIPWEERGKSSLSVVVQSGTVASTPQTIILSAFNPGLFATNSQGAGQGAILLAGTGSLAAPADAFPDSHPAARGSFVELFATGLGVVTNTPLTGTPDVAPPFSTTIQASVTIGNIDASVTFSGLAPGYVGLYQVNVQVPSNAPVGPAVPVVLTIGGTMSNTVTMAVQ